MTNAAKIAELEAEVAKLKKEDAIFAALLPEHQLAITLHKLLCHWNHVDGCGWEYESDKNGAQWSGHAHAQYLAKALKVQAFCQRCHIATSDAVDLIRLMKD